MRAGLTFVMALLIAACSSGATSGPSTEAEEIPASLLGRPLTIAEIGELELRVAVADTPASRSRGLMGVVDFGSIDGMAFVFDSPTETGFYMKDVPAPLDIAFITADGTVLATLTMPVCAADPCPRYHSPAPFLWALETPAGGLAGISAGDRFMLRPWAAAGAVAG